MSRRRACARALFVLFSWAWLSPLQPCWAQTPSLGSSAPVLMWQYGGCIPGPYCNTGWYSSPVVADLDGDGQQDVIWGSYDVVALNGANGSLKWRAPSGNRVWPGIAVADLTGNGTLEVIVGRSSDQLTVYDRLGNVVWTQNPFGTGELRTLAVADLESDGRLEILVGRTGSNQTPQLTVFEPNGTVRPGWPVRHSGEPGFGWGLYNENVAVADMNGDGFKQVFSPTTGHYITAVDRNGNQLPANAIYNNISPVGPKVWSQVGVHVDNAVDLRGYANCGVEHRPTFEGSAPVVTDVDGDGVPELIVVGNVYNCGTNTSLYHMPFIFKLDRTRWNGSGFDWTVIPTPGPGSAPRSEDYNVIENVVPNAVVADLDGDGLKEILFPSYDGKVHAYWLDKTEHGSWPYIVPTRGAPGDDFRFASEPVVVDLDNDGHAEVIFTSWPKKATGGVGQLHVLDYLGRELYRVDLPTPAIGAGWNGSLGAPTIANIDSDPDLELVMGTNASGVVAYKLPNTANARVLWGTGRGNYGRTGVPGTVTAPPPPDTTPPTVSLTSPANGATISGTVMLTASASDNIGVVGVQFSIDGINFGAEDTSAPYSIPWDTASVSDGSHTITAVARDAAGNLSAPSATVTVTVDNNAPPPPPPPGSTTRFEETDPAVAYAGSWTQGDTRKTWSGGSAALSTTTGAQTTFTFTGPSVSWIGGRADSTGIARISLDGVFLTEVDTYSKTEEIRVPMFAATGLANARHTLTIEVTGRQNAAAMGAFVVVDAFDVPAATVSRLQATDPSITYSAGSLVAPDWLPFDTSRAWSAGLATLSKTTGARATISFTGTGISWIGARGPQTGKARVTLDGVVSPVIDTYSAAEQIQAEVFAKQGLADTSHTLTVEVTGEQNAASTSPLIVVDGFEVTMSGTRHQDTDPAIAYGPNWIQDNRDKAYSEGASAESHTVGAQATITFTGTGIRWIGARGPQCGIARIFLDGAFVEDFDTYFETEGPQHTDFFRSGLAPGTHTLSIQVLGKNPLSSDFWILIDAFDVIP